MSFSVRKCMEDEDGEKMRTEMRMEIVVKQIYMLFLQNSLTICEEATRVSEKDEVTVPEPFYVIWRMH